MLFNGGDERSGGPSCVPIVHEACERIPPSCLLFSLAALRFLSC
jgi:hypothetical protein